MKNTLIFNRDDEEFLVVSYNGETIFESSHDELGWVGMDAVETALSKFAEVLLIPIKEI